MKQALKTVTTQLLNVSDTNESTKKLAELKMNGNPKKENESKKLVTAARIENIENSANGKEKSKTEDKDLLIKEINTEISSLETMGVSFGRPLNSKFGYFETSHPGEAMAMTDEELEKEFSSKRDRLAYGTQTTTSAGISTWILLNSPTTTPRSAQKDVEKKPETINKFVAKPTALIEKVKIGQKVEQNPTATVQRVAATLSAGKTPANFAKPAAVNVKNNPKVTTTAKPSPAHQTPAKRVEQSSGDSATAKIATTTTQVTPVVKQGPFTTERPSSTPGKKFAQTQIRNSQQKLGATPTTTVRPTTKPTKVNVNRGKYPARTTTTLRPLQKLEKTSPATVERVTFRPVQIVTMPKGGIKIDKPAVPVANETPSPIQALKTTPTPPARSTTPKIKEATTVATKTDFTGSDLIEIPIQTKPPVTRVNVLKGQMKRPANEAPKVEVQSSKLNGDTGEKMIEELSDQSVSQALNNSQVDLRFDFNPELTKIETQDPTESPVATTTKKPRRSSQKRRKNKNKTRRRKPSSTTTESNEIPAEPIVDETTIQESKVEPETKEGAVTKNKIKKQVQKPIGTQIYNFLSREIMPSFGVVSLVGLGLGIASYFLYPFGGGIARRNYEVEPNYKYNLGEYGGNYGQNEEEVFSKVLQGMTNHEDKYGGFKDYNDQNSYYRYQKFGAPTFSAAKLSKKSDNRYSPSSSSGPTYKPMENTYDLKYRNTEFKYPEVATTPNYFERQKQSGYTVSGEANVDQQFVVGSVPKEYGYDESPVLGQKTPTYGGNSESQTEFDRTNAQSYAFPKTSANVPLLQSQPYGQPEALPLKSDVNYDEIEITPTAVAVEHGPRALKVKRSVEDAPPLGFYPRFRRESVIQVIPPTGSLEVDEKEEDLSNEIFDILDLMIPGKEESRNVKEGKGSNAIDSEKKIGKKKEGGKSTSGENSGADQTLIFTTTKAPASSSAAPSSTTTEDQNVETTSAASAPANEETTTVTQPKDDGSTDEDVTETEGQDLEETTLEWNETSTTEQPVKEEEHGYDIIGFVKRVAEIKFRLGLTILKHASEGFARYLGGVQKRFNGEE